MNVKLTSDRAAVVDKNYHWLDASKHPPPRGSKLLCINKHHGTATIGYWVSAFNFTHWAPLPTFNDAEEQEAS